MPLDIKLFRADHAGGDPDAIRESQRRRFQSPDIVDEVIDLDTQWRDCRSKIDCLNKDRNRFQKGVTKAKKAGGEDPENAAKILEVAKETKVQEAKLAELGQKVSKLLPKIGNIVAKDVPTSDDEDKDNEIVSTFGPTPKGDHYMHHHEVLHRIGGYEPERGVGVAGHRAYFLRDAGLLLSQALINYGIAFLRKQKYSVLQPPYFMTKDVMAGVAQLEQFDEELYKVSGEGTEEKYLIATSEQPICAFHRGEWLQESELPLRYGGVSTCFRKEAGAHGKDTWGIFRVHQFEKVEQFCICEGDLEKSAAMQSEMSKTSEEFYKSLGLSYRVVNIVSGELNNAAIKKYDLEAWFPAYEEFRELVSCSNCTDYQSRAMEVRSGQKKMGQQDKKYVHMLNSTLCATTRTISCILENYQTPTGVTVPEVLVPYMGGITFLDYVKELPKGKREAKGSTKGGYATNATAKKSTPKKATPPPEAPPASAGGAAPESTSRGLPELGGGSEIDSIEKQILAKGDEIRDLKKSKADKAALQPHIDALLSLKADYKKHADRDYVPPGANQAKAKQPKPAPKPSAKASAEHSSRKKTPKPAPKREKAPAAEPSASRGLSPPSASKSPLAANGMPDLDHLAQHLLNFSYVAGFAPGKEDASTFETLSDSAEAQALPAVARWLGHMTSFSCGERAAWL